MLRLGTACFNDTTHDCDMVSYIYNCKHKYVLMNYIYAFLRIFLYASINKITKQDCVWLHTKINANNHDILSVFLII